MLTCTGAPMRISQAPRSRANPAMQLRSASSNTSVCRLHGLRGHAGLIFRVSSVASGPAAAETHPSDGIGDGGRSPAAAAAAAINPLPAEPIPAPPPPAAEPLASPPSGADSSSAAAASTATATSTTPKPINANFTGDMLKPSVVNTPLVRAAAVVGTVAAVAGSTLLLPNTFGAFLHVTAYAVLLGTQLWNTFFVGITMFKNVPRQTFGRVQAQLFPQYFALTAGANLLALATLALAGASASGPGVRALAALTLSLAGLMANWLAIEPICTSLMFQRYDIENLPEKTDADKERIATLYKQFGKWHGISSLVNLVSFCVAVGHGWFLASLLVVAS